jgi:hypothetical protein
MHYHPGRTAASIFSLALAALWLGAGWCGIPRLTAAEAGKSARPDPFQGQSTESAKQSAISIIPLEKLDVQGRAKVHAVLSNITVFRRLPVRVIDCDPDLYLFAVRHPDVVVNIWEVLKLSQLELKQTAEDKFTLKETSGTTAEMEFLYHGHDVNILYAEGTYDGSAITKPVKGRALFVLKSGYVRETDGRYYVTSRLDVFLSIEPGAVEVVTKVLSPLLSSTADNNFTQTVSFVGSLSRTTEVNARGVERMASHLERVQPQVRDEFAALAEQISKKPSAALLRQALADKPPPMALEKSEAKKR